MAKKTDNSSLQKSIDELNKSIKDLIKLFKTAAEEPSADELELKKIDVLIQHNEDLANAMLLLLEINRENLPKIAAELKERPAQQPAAQLPAQPLWPQQQRPQPVMPTTPMRTIPLQPRQAAPAVQQRQMPQEAQQMPFYTPQQPKQEIDLDLELPDFTQELPKKKGLF